MIVVFLFTTSFFVRKIQVRRLVSLQNVQIFNIEVRLRYIYT